MTLSEIRRILEVEGIQLTKSLGQNFLHDGNQVRRIAAAAALAPGDKVLEIGPGLGPLTELLLEHAAELLAIEKDKRLFDFLHKRFPGCDRLKLLHDDALVYLRRVRPPFDGWKLIANLPYSVASPILVELAWNEYPPAVMATTLQWEVAQRLMAKPDCEDYGVLTLLIQLRYEVADIFKISASCFFPPPTVDSACITLRKRAIPLLEETELKTFGKLVKQAFSQRRKMMFKLLKQSWSVPVLEAAFDALNISRMIRAEHLNLADFVNLTKILAAPTKPNEPLMPQLPGD